MSLKHFLPFFLPVFIILLLVAASPAAAEDIWNTQAISPGNVNALSGDISDGHVIYTIAYGDPIEPSTKRGVALYSITTEKTYMLANSSPGRTLTGAEISGAHAVWFEEAQLLDEEDNRENQIVLYSIPSENITIIRQAPGVAWPKISGNNVIWSESVKDSFNTSMVLYSIDTGSSRVIPGVNTIDTAGVNFDGDRILYQDAETLDLRLYSLADGSNLTISTFQDSKDMSRIIESYALGGDFVLYSTRITRETGERGIFHELSLYTISTGKIRYINPATGEFLGDTEARESDAAFDYPFTDGRRIGWVYLPAIEVSTVMILDPAEGSASSLRNEGFAYSPRIDGTQASWQSSARGEHGRIMLATEAGTRETAATIPAASPPTPAPGFCAPSVALALAGAAAIGIRKLQAPLRRG